MTMTNNGHAGPTLEEMAGVLDKAHLKSGMLRACCPAHGGEDPNLSLTYGDDGKLLARCHSHHCDFKDIMAAIRQKLGILTPEDSVVDITHKGRRLGDAGSKNDAVERGVRHIPDRTIWKLRDEQGKLVALHVRDDLGDGEKKVWWRLPSGKSGLGGKSTGDLPLYGIEDYARVSGGWIVVAEGEKAADALRASRTLRESGVGAVGTVTGAAGTPGKDVLKVLRNRRVILWPDNDGPGREHMGRVADALKDVASEIRWFEWEDAPEKGDAADHPALESRELAELLKLSPRWSRLPAIEGLVTNMGDVIRRGVDPPEELLPDILLKGKAHNVYAPGGVGKTWVLVWLAKELLARGNKVAVFDLENGLRTYAERLEEVGADCDALNERFAYGAFPSLDVASYARFLDEWKPDIVMFDSWIGFLAAEGHDENVSNDISAWADSYSKPALRRGIAVLVLDHVPHEHERERGSSRKRDEMDVVWKLTKIGDYDRDQTATLSMTRQKDREGWLPEKLTFEIGGDPSTGEFVMRRDDSLARRVEVTHLNRNEKVALTALKTFGEEGATTAEWLQKVHEVGDAEIHKRTLHKIRGSLVGKEKVIESSGKYIAQEDECAQGVPPYAQGMPEHIGHTPQSQGAPGGVPGVPPLTGGDTRQGTPPYAESPLPKDEDVLDEGAHLKANDLDTESGGLGARLRRIRDERRSRE